MFYAVSSFGSQNSAIGLATSTTLEPGQWNDHGGIGLASTTGVPYNAIDPSLVRSGNSYYLNFGSFWGDIYQVPMSTDLTSPAGRPVNMIYNPSGSHAIEGSNAYQNGNYFYMFWSAGQCCGLNTNKPPPGGEYSMSLLTPNLSCPELLPLCLIQDSLFTLQIHQFPNISFCFE
jgi:arabinan endo-1,5-alpha-L-arabinosidase